MAVLGIRDSQTSELIMFGKVKTRREISASRGKNESRIQVTITKGRRGVRGFSGHRKVEEEKSGRVLRLASVLDGRRGG